MSSHVGTTKFFAELVSYLAGNAALFTCSNHITILIDDQYAECNTHGETYWDAYRATLIGDKGENQQERALNDSYDPFDK